MATFDATGAQTMITAPKYDFRPLLYLLSLGVVGAATVGTFFGASFLLLRGGRLDRLALTIGHER